MVKRKRSTKRRTKPKKVAKRRTTAKRSTKTLSKKYTHYTRQPPRRSERKKVAPPQRRGGKQSMQPRTTPSRAPNPVNMTDVVLREVKKRVAEETKEPEKAKRNFGKRAVKRFKQAAKGAKKGAKKVGDMIEWTGKAYDKFEGQAVKWAPTLNALAVETENPFVAGVAGVVDAVALGAQFRNSPFLDMTASAMERGDTNRLGMAQLTDTGKYQKLMLDVSDEDIPMGGTPAGIHTLVPYVEQEADVN